MRRIILFGLAVSLLLPCTLSAQKKKTSSRPPIRVIHVKPNHSYDCCWRNRWFLQPYAGVINDAYDNGPDGDNTTLLIGSQVGYTMGWRTRLLANVSYAHSDDVTDPLGIEDHFIFDNTFVNTTVGGEFDVVPGRASASVGLQFGVSWRRIDVDRRVGPGIIDLVPPADEGFSAQEVLVPSLSGRYWLYSRVLLIAGIQDYIRDIFGGPTQHSVAVTAGVAFR